MAITRGILEDMHVYASEHVLPRAFSSVYDVPVLLTLLSMTGSVEGSFTPGSELIVGKNLGFAQKTDIAGSSQFQGFYQKNEVSGGKYIGVNDTGSSAGNDYSSSLMSSFYVSWFEREDPLQLNNVDIEPSLGKYKVLNAVDVGVQDLKSRHMDAFGTDIYTGTPADYTAVQYDNWVGVDEWIHNSNNLCGVDRSLAANANFRGQYSTGALNLSLKLIDDVCIEGAAQAGGGTTTPLTSKASRADLVILSQAGYNKIKQEAMARQIHQATDGPSLNEGAHIGFLRDYVNYNGKIITFDPKAAANSMYILDSQSFTFQCFKGKNFSLSKFVNHRELIPGAGQSNVTTSAMTTKARLICHEPWKNWRGTNVS